MLHRQSYATKRGFYLTAVAKVEVDVSAVQRVERRESGGHLEVEQEVVDEARRGPAKAADAVGIEEARLEEKVSLLKRFLQHAFVVILRLRLRRIGQRRQQGDQQAKTASDTHGGSGRGEVAEKGRAQGLCGASEGAGLVAARGRVHLMLIHPGGAIYPNRRALLF